MINKIKLTITVDKKLLEALDKYCNEKYFNKSKLLNGLLKEYLIKNDYYQDDTK